MTSRFWSRASLVTFGVALAGPVCGITLEEYAQRQPLAVQTVRAGEAVDLGKGNQTNNLKEGGKVLLLSGKGLTSLNGISHLRVLDEGHEVTLPEVERL